MTVRKIILEGLKNKHTEQVIKSQLITLAKENLHKEGMADVLATVLPFQNDTSIKQQVLGLLLTIDASRLSKSALYYKSLINIFKTEKELEVRMSLLNKLANSISHDKAIIPVFLELFAGETLKDKEQEVVFSAVSKMPIISPEIATMALQKAVKSTINIQVLALRIAEGCPHWNNEIIQALEPYLTPSTNKNLKIQIINKLQETKRLDESFLPLLINLAATDQDKHIRLETLNVLSKFKPLRSDVIIQFVASAISDSSQAIRKRALELQNNISRLNTDVVLKLLTQLKLEASNAVRITILNLVSNYLKNPEVQEAVLQAYTAHSGAIEPKEQETYLNLLEPYMSRNKQIIDLFLKDLIDTAKIDVRKKILQSLLKHCCIDEILNEILTVFVAETDDKLRKELFLKFKRLSLAKHPKLVNLFCEELKEPSSSFRLECAMALEPNVLQFNEIPMAFEEVLLYDQDQELIRLCLDAYLREGVKQKFEPLLKVVENEFFDLSSRQKTVKALGLMKLSNKEQEVLTTVLQSVERTGL